MGGPCLTKDPYILDEVIDTDFKNKSIFTISRDINNKIVFNLIENIKTFLGDKNKKRILLCGISFVDIPRQKIIEAR